MPSDTFDGKLPPSHHLLCFTGTGLFPCSTELVSGFSIRPKKNTMICEVIDILNQLDDPQILEILATVCSKNGVTLLSIESAQVG